MRSGYANLSNALSIPITDLYENCRVLIGFDVFRTVSSEDRGGGTALSPTGRTYNSATGAPLIPSGSNVTGRGTTKIIESCRAEGFPDPELTERDGGFPVTLFKNRFTEEQLAKLGLNPRQIKAVLYVRENGRITNSEYWEINSIKKTAATEDLAELVEKYRIFTKIGKGAGSHYKIAD